LNTDRCDVVIGLPTRSDLTQTTRPYYRSSYVFVSRSGEGLDLQSFDDPRLRRLRVGVQMIGDDASNSPPAHALSNRGIVSNVVGFPVFGDYAAPRPLSPIVDAVARGELDIAVVWGPTAGFFARGRQLEIRPVVPDFDSPSLPLAFDISMGVKRGNDALRAELDDFLSRRAGDIARILLEYGVPLVRDNRHAATD
jgi:mxaJ protein